MESLAEKKLRAIKFRQKGRTYGEIREHVDVSKSTLSLWLRNVKVPEKFLARIYESKLKAVRLGWEARRNQRITRTEQIITSAREEVKKLMSDPLWLVGVTLYWAEGHKEKLWRPGALTTFTNMDEDTIILFMEWCRKFLSVRSEDFICSLYIHDSHKARVPEVRKWWAKKLSVKAKNIAVYYKKTVIKHVRHNDGHTYRGVIRIRVKKSTDISRRIAGWTSELVHSLKGNMG